MRMRGLVKTLGVSATLMVAPMIHGAIVQGSGNVTVIIAYTDHTSGTFSFRISNPPAGCFGYWISPSQPGFKTAVAFVMQARATGEPVLVGADNAQLWSGSNDPWCKVDYVGTPY
jgi:hypothetical protein